MTKKEKLIDSAQKALQKGSLDKALADYKLAAIEDPKDTRTWLKIAEIQTKRGKKDDATHTYLKTAELYTEQGFFQRAVAVYKNVLKLTPGFVEAHFKLADLFRQLGLLSDAMQQYEAAASVYQRDGKVTEALDAMRRIVELNPDHVMSRIKLAEAAAQAGLKDEAIGEFGRAAGHLKLVGKIDEYLRVAERLLAQDAGNLDLARDMAEAYIERGNGRFALAKLQPAFNQNPRDLRTLTLLSRAFEQLGQVAKTVSILKEVARIHRDEGREEEGLAAFQKILVLDPTDAESRNEMARAHKAAAAPPVLRAGKAGAATAPAAITFSEMAVPQFLMPRDGSSSISLPRMSPLSPSAISSTSLPAIGAGPVLTTTAESANPDVARILSECDVFVKYALLERAAEHLRKVFDIEAANVGARERLAFVLLQLGRNSEAATQFAMLSDQFKKSDPNKAAEYARNATAARPILEKTAAYDPATDPGANPEMTAPGDTDDILEVDDLGGEFIGESSTAGGSSTAEFAAVYRTANTGRPPAAAGKEPAEPVAAYRGDNWNPPTFAEMVLPQFGEFDSADRTSGESSPADDALTADLEQVDFFLESGLAEEARSLIEDLEVRYPANPAVVERRERLASAQGAVPGGAPSAKVAASPAARPRAGGAAAADATPGAVAVELKRSGDLDGAIAEFRKLLRDPGKEVFALMMIGECFEDKGSLPDAVMNFKKALNRPHVTDAETTQIYYSLGKVFVALGDDKEALYFFEKVQRRNSDFRDVRSHVAKLKRGAAS